MNKKAFTLAEVLITLSIIGIVAAITLPSLIQEYKDRQYKIQSTNFQRKFGEALKIMDVQSNLQGLSTTEEFISELKKQIKITKVCTTKLTECFDNPVKLADGTILDISDIKTSSDLGRPDYETNIAGVQFADGVTALLAYNPKYTNNDPTKTIKFSYIKEGKLNLVNLSTGVVSIIFDTTGYEKPNQVGVDIIGVNAMLGGQKSSNEVVQVGPYQVLDIGTGYTALPCIESTGINSEYCGSSYSDYTNDYYAGAQKACVDLGMQLPTTTQLVEIYAYLTQDESIATKFSGVYMASTYQGRHPYCGAGGRLFRDGINLDNGGSACAQKNTRTKVICIQ